MENKRFIGFVISILLVLLSYSQHMWAKDVTITPAIELKTVYDDNLNFESSDEKDAVGANAIPRLTLDYASELFQFSLIGEVDVIKYFSETDFDRTNQLYGIDGEYRISPRWKFNGGFKYNRDETTDTILQETGQAFERNRVTTYDSGAGLFYQVTESSDIGFATDYRRRDYGSRFDNDFQRYTFSLPYTKRLSNQRDTVSLVPAYTIFNSDDSEDATDYLFEIRWKRRISETLTSTVNAGGRYLEIEQDDGSNDTNWGYTGLLGLQKRTETFFGEIEAARELRANSNAEIVEVNRLALVADKRLHERFGFRFYGAGYYTDTVSSNDRNQKTTYFELVPTLYYLLTENHRLVLEYNYQNKIELDEPGNPVTQRNRVWLGVVLQFPKKW